VTNHEKPRKTHQKVPDATNDLVTWVFAKSKGFERFNWKTSRAAFKSFFFKSQLSNRPGLHRVGHCRENGHGREKRVNNQQISSKTNKSLRPWSHVSHVHKLERIFSQLAGDVADT
jgi:hypothetical protein